MSRSYNLIPESSAIFRFTKDLRLLTPRMYTAVFETTDFKVHQPNFLLIVKCQPTASCSRLGLAITKKKVKRANQRNRIKRLCREYFRLHHQDFIGFIDIVLVVKSFSEEIPNNSIRQQFQYLFQQVNTKLSNFASVAV